MDHDPTPIPPAGGPLVPDPPSPGPTVVSGDGASLATWDFGGRGAPLLLVHATGLHAWTWLPLARALTPSWRVWAYDQRGHGASGPSPDRTYRDWWAYADDLLRVVDGLGLAGCAAVGHSLGGAALLMAEARRPGTCRGLYLYEPIVFPAALPGPPDGPGDGGSGGNFLAEGARRRRATFECMDPPRAHTPTKPPFATMAPGVVEAYVAHGFTAAPGGGVTLRLPGEEEATVYEGAPSAGMFERLGEIHQPVTVAHGDDGAGTPADLAPHVAAGIAGATVAHLRGMGHFGPMEDPVRVAASIDAALRPPA